MEANRVMAPALVADMAAGVQKVEVVAAAVGAVDVLAGAARAAEVQQAVPLWQAGGVELGLEGAGAQAAQAQEVVQEMAQEMAHEVPEAGAQRSAELGWEDVEGQAEVSEWAWAGTMLAQAELAQLGTGASASGAGAGAAAGAAGAAGGLSGWLGWAASGLAAAVGAAAGGGSSSPASISPSPAPAGPGGSAGSGSSGSTGAGGDVGGGDGAAGAGPKSTVLSVTAVASTVTENALAQFTVSMDGLYGDPALSLQWGGNSTEADLGVASASHGVTINSDGTLNVPAGVSSFTVARHIVADNVTKELGETLVATVGGKSSAAVEILDVIDLGVLNGQSMGQLIAGVHVDGRYYYAWDFNKDGVHNSADVRTMNWLRDNLFGGNPVTESNRSLTINGVNLMLPTDGNLAADTHVNPGPNAPGETDFADGRDIYTPGQTVAGTNATGWYLAQGTSVSGSGVNASYDDLLAIWDAFNGAGQNNSVWSGSAWVSFVGGAPPGWVTGHYWSATPSGSGHAYVSLGTGHVNAYTDLDSSCVAFEVL